MISIATARTETDSFGPVDVPGDAYWGAQTQRWLQNFLFGPRETMPVEDGSNVVSVDFSRKK